MASVAILRQATSAAAAKVQKRMRTPKLRKGRKAKRRKIDREVERKSTMRIQLLMLQRSSLRTTLISKLKRSQK